MNTDCISSEQMAALVEGNLPAAMKNILLGHIVQCAECYEEYLTLLDLQEEDRALHIVSSNGMDMGDLTQGMAIGLSANLTLDPDLTLDPNQTFDPGQPIAGPGHIPMAAATDHAVNSFGEKHDPSHSDDVHQASIDTCAIKAQQLILKDFGIHVPEETLTQEALEKGWYAHTSSHHPGGTPMPDIGKLLESHGIPVHRAYDGNVYSLVSELAQGHEVIVDVDAHSLWHPSFMEKLKDVFVSVTPNHALIVAGINTTDEHNVRVILKDPGTGDVAKEYPLGHFLDAWKDSHYFMVSTAIPVPDMKHFNYAQGHIDEIGHYSYHDFHSAFAARIEPYDHSSSIPGFSGSTSFIHKIVDFFEYPQHHDHIEVNNHDAAHDHPDRTDDHDHDHDNSPDDH